MNIVLISSISNNPHQGLCILFYFWCVFQNWEIKVNAIQNEVMHSSKIIFLPDFHFQIKIEEQNLLIQQRNILCSFFFKRRGWDFVYSDIWEQTSGSTRKAKLQKNISSKDENKRSLPASEKRKLNREYYTADTETGPAKAWQ